MTLHTPRDESTSFGDVHFDWEALSAGVHRCRLPFLDVTVGLVAGARGVMLIDCGTTLLEAEGIAADVRALTGRTVTHVVLTHHHFDHVLGAAGFGDAELYGAPRVDEALTTRVAEVRSHAVSYGADPAEVDRAIACARPLDHQVLGTDVELGERLVHVEQPGRGHTDHDLVVVVPPTHPSERVVVFCGDLVEESADPAIDDDSDVREWPTTLSRVLDLGGRDALYVPGHGAVVDAAFVRGQRDWLTARAATDGP